MFKNSPFEGIGYLLQGFSLLTRSGLKRFVIIPVLLNILFFSLLMGVGVHFISLFINHYVYLLPEWLHWLKWLLWIVFFFTGAIIVIYCFTIITNLICAPFNGLLSERVEKVLTGKTPSLETSFGEALTEIPRSLKREWSKIKYYLPRAIFLIILFFIPVVNIIASVLWFIFVCWMMAVEYMDYPIDNRKLDFKRLLKYLKQHCLTSLGFGFAVIIASLIPVINFVIIPAAVIGGTCMWIEKERNGPGG